jgi:peptide/nickel transport system permease protein
VIRTFGVRFLHLIVVLVIVSIMTFLLMNLVPGDPAASFLGPTATSEDYERVREELGLDRSIPARYWDWASHAVRGDFGDTLTPPIESVSDRVMRALPVSLELAVLALGMALLLAIPTAVWSAYRLDGRLDRVATGASFTLISVPSFVLALLLVLFAVLQLGWFPRAGWVRPSEGGWGKNLEYAFLPALTLALVEWPVFTRLLRSDMISTLQEDYILAARAKGMPTRHILFREALRPSSFSLITLAGLSLGRIIGGAVIVETIFGIPGIGRTIVDGALARDYTLVQGAVMVVATVYVVVNAVIDLSYSYLDPRIRRG